MNRVQDGPIDTLARRHPEHAWTIRQLHRRDEEFRDLCEDYGEALSALQHWRQASSGPAQERVAEYHQLATELAERVLAYVETHGKR
jgi:hypothetical protein